MISFILGPEEGCETKQLSCAGFPGWDVPPLEKTHTQKQEMNTSINGCKLYSILFWLYMDILRTGNVNGCKVLHVGKIKKL